jgi:glycosyltransferase involved in cell wall biosynthesis
MKITILNLGRKGASTVYSLAMAKELCKNNSLQIILSSTVENKNVWLSEFCEKSNVQLSFYNTYHSKLTFLLQFFNVFYYRQLLKEIKSFKSEFVYSPFLHLTSPILFFFLRNKKIISTVHDVKMHLGENIFFFVIQYFSIKLSTYLIILNSNDIEAAKRYGFLRDQICVIPHASFAYYQSNIPNSIAEKYILFIGRIERYKGIELLLEAFKIIAISNIDIKLVIAGEGDLMEYYDKIKNFGNRVQVINKWLSDEEVGSLVANCYFVVLPYKQASQSGIVALAFGFGKTLVATNVGALSEQIPENLGLVVSPEKHQFANAVLKLLDDASMLKEFEKKIPSYVADNLTWSQSVSTLINFIKSK